jgi:hypothetical protein
MGQEAEEGQEATGGTPAKGPIDVISKKKSEEGQEAEEAGKKGEAAEEASKRPTGKGIVAVDELQGNKLQGPDYNWFTKDILPSLKAFDTRRAFK